MPDPFASYQRSPEGPADRAFTITPHNTNDLADVTRAIYVGGAGDLRVLTVQGNDVVFPAVPAGTILPIRVQRVFATNTTATNIVGLQ